MFDFIQSHFAKEVLAGQDKLCGIWNMFSPPLSWSVAMRVSVSVTDFPDLFVQQVYPTVVKLARKMAGFAIFARVMGDENEWCQQLLQRNKVLEVPTFIFLKDKKQQARYVGSSRGSLIGEILKLQGICQ